MMGQNDMARKQWQTTAAVRGDRNECRQGQKDKTETTHWGVANSSLLSCTIQWKNPEALRA